MTYSTEEKAMWVEDWRRSGKKAWTYARENGLIPQTFVGWAKKGARAAIGFVEIPNKVKPQIQAAGIIIEKGDIRIHIPLGVSGSELRTVIECLEPSYRGAAL